MTDTLEEIARETAEKLHHIALLSANAEIILSALKRAVEMGRAEAMAGKGFNAFQETKARAEAAEARIVELTRERDEAVAYRDDNEKRWHAELNSHAVTRSMYVAAKDERDEARVQVTALTAENAVAREILETLPDQFYSTCPEETEILKAARDFCSTPNTKAMRMVKFEPLLREANDFLTGAFSGYISGSGPDMQWDRDKEALIKEINAALDGEQG